LSEWGFNVKFVCVNENYSPNQQDLRALVTTIVNTGAKLAIVDVGLGYFNGIYVIERLREQIQIIMFTGLLDNSEIHGIADEYIRKPARMESIVPVIKRLLERYKKKLVKVYF